MKILMIVGGVFAAIALVAVMLVFGFLGFQNEANRFENDIKAQYAENQNVYDNGFKKVMEVASVPTAQVAAMKDVYMGAISGTFGPNGSQAMFQAFTAHQINIDQSTFLKVQTVIEEFRNKFEQRQSEMVDRTRSYENFRTTSTSSRIYNSLAGYPKIDMEKYGKLVTSAQTQDAFTTKQAAPLQVFPTKP